MKAIDEDSEGRATAQAVLRRLALKANGMTGADIERLVREARQKARRCSQELVFSDLFDMLTAARPARSHALRWRMALHEAGHAVAQLCLGIGRITTITIESPRGGYIESAMVDIHDETEELARDVLTVRLAGRAAEQEMLGSVTAGSGGSPDSDLGEATRLAEAMETTLGFSTDLPLLYRSVPEHFAVLNCNPRLAEIVNARLEDAYDQARELIRDHRDAVQYLAEAVMRQGMLEGQVLEFILARVRDQLVSLKLHP